MVKASFGVHAERAFLDVLDGSCHTPIAGLAEISGPTVRLRGLVAREDGARLLTVERSGPVDHAVALAQEAGHALLKEMGDGFFD